MQTTESPSQQPNRHDLVDLQYQEVAAARTAVLNRELVRMRSEGWTVQMAGDHLVASRKEAGRSQMERGLICVAGFLAIAYVATLVMPDLIEKIGTTKPVFFGAAILIGALATRLTGGQAARTKSVTVSVDGQGRPYVSG